MAIFASDDFSLGNPGTSISGRTSSGGDVWSANLDLGHGGDALLYPLTGLAGTSSKVGLKNTAPTGASAIYALKASPVADYGANFTFEFGNNVAGRDSIGPCIRFQETVPAAALNYYAAWYNAVVNRWDLVGNFGLGTTILGSFSHVYAAGTVNSYTLRACGTAIELIENGITIISVTDATITLPGQIGIVATDSGTFFNDADGWWIRDMQGDTGACSALPVQFGLYFAGSGIPAGQDFVPVDYGAPTNVVINDPQTGFEYSVGPLNPADLAGFLQARMGNVKLRRAGIQNSTNVVFRGMDIRYRKA